MPPDAQIPPNPNLPPNRHHPTAPQPASWLRALAKQNRATWPTSRSIRAALAVGTPLVVSALVGDAAIGVMAAIGALLPSVSEKPVPYPQRLKQLAVGSVMACLGYLTVASLPQHPVPIVLGITALALVAGIVSGYSARLSGGSLQMLLLATLAPHMLPLAGLWGVPAGVLAGGGWAATLLAIEYAVVRRGPEHRLLATYLDAVATLAATPPLAPRETSDHVERDDGAAEPTPVPAFEESEAYVTARRAVTDARAAAYAQMLGARAVSQGRSGHQEERALRLAAIGDLAAALITVQLAPLTTPSSPSPPPTRDLDALASWLHQVAHAEREGLTPPSPPATLDPALQTPASALHAALPDYRAPAASTRRTTKPHDAQPRTTRPLTTRLSDAEARLAVGHETWVWALRLTLCMAVAATAMELLPGRSYWVPLTVAVVMKPDFGSVFVRGVHRSAGTVLGAGIGSVLVLTLPKGPLLIAVILVLVACMPWAAQRSYAMMAVFVTPMVVVLVDYATPGATVNYAGERLVDTVIGAAIVLVLGYLIWPGARGAHVPRAFAHAGAGIADYLAQLADPRQDATTTAPARRAALRSLSDLRTQLQRSLAEPPPANRTALAWFPAITAAERLCDAVTAELGADRTGLAAPLTERATWLRHVLDEARPALPAPEPRLAVIDVELARLQRLTSEPGPHPAGGVPQPLAAP